MPASSLAKKSCVIGVRNSSNNVISGAFTPVLNGIQPMSLPAVAQPLATSAALIRSMSTANLSYGWFIASQPYWFQENFWWGESLVANNTATNNFVNDMNFFAVNGFFASLIPPGILIVGLTAGLAGAYAYWASSNNHGYGVHFNFVGGSAVPEGVFSNQP